MTSARPTIFVDVAPPILRASSLLNHELDSRLHDTWRCSAYFTCTQLGSGFLVQANRTHTPFTLAEAVDAISQQAVQLAEASRHVDPRLLHPHTARERVQAFLFYAEQRGLIRSIGPLTWEPVMGDTFIKVRLGEIGYVDAPLAYAWNELQDLLSVPSGSPASP